MAPFFRFVAFVLPFVVSLGVDSRAAAAGPQVSGILSGLPVLVADDDTAKNATAAPGKSGGTIDGFVTAIDYRSSTMTVAAGSRKVDVLILPSTNIAGPSSGFRTIADIAKGSHVRVLLSQRAGLFTAQIITLR